MTYLLVFNFLEILQYGGYKKKNAIQWLICQNLPLIKKY